MIKLAKVWPFPTVPIFYKVCWLYNLTLLSRTACSVRDLLFVCRSTFATLYQTDGLCSFLPCIFLPLWLTWDPTCRVVIILQLDVLGTLPSIVGNPKPIENVMGGSSGTKAQQQQQQFPQHQTQSISQPIENVMGGGFGRDQGAGGHEEVTPIKGLTPYQNRWTIRARVATKSQKRSFTNAKGSGSLFSIDVLDAQGGEIRCLFFGKAAEHFFPIIEQGRVRSNSLRQLF